MRTCKEGKGNGERRKNGGEMGNDEMRTCNEGKRNGQRER